MTAQIRKAKDAGGQTATLKEAITKLRPEQTAHLANLKKYLEHMAGILSDRNDATRGKQFLELQRLVEAKNTQNSEMFIAVAEVSQFPDAVLRMAKDILVATAIYSPFMIDRTETAPKLLAKICETRIGSIKNINHNQVRSILLEHFLPILENAEKAEAREAALGEMKGVLTRLYRNESKLLETMDEKTLGKMVDDLIDAGIGYPDETKITGTKSRYRSITDRIRLMRSSELKELDRDDAIRVIKESRSIVSRKEAVDLLARSWYIGILQDALLEIEKKIPKEEVTESESGLFGLIVGAAAQLEKVLGTNGKKKTDEQLVAQHRELLEYAQPKIEAVRAEFTRRFVSHLLTSELSAMQGAEEHAR